MEKYAIKKPETVLMRDKLEDLQLLTIGDVAELFKVSRRTIEGLLYETKRIPYLKIGKEVRIRERDIVRFLGRTSQGA